MKKKLLLALSVSLALSASAGTKLLWTELIGFDNESADYGVGEYLSRMSIKPDGVSILFTEPEIVNGYESLDRDYPIGDAHCSYCARPWNEERRRQRWTAFQVKGLVAELKRHGIETYPSFFEKSVGPTAYYWERFRARRLPSVLIDRHPEIGYVKKNGKGTQSICTIKRFADGTYYEDFFAEKIARFCRDFGFAGFHASDGYGHPRFPLNEADFSDDVLEQFAKRNPDLALPPGTREEKAGWILENARAEWCRFYAQRYAGFMGKVAKALHAQGMKVYANTCWTRDPHEALYRYGVDYRLLEKAGVDGFINEASATILEIEGWNPDIVSSLDRCRATILRNASAVNIPFFHLAGIKDGMEQYNALRHSPSRLEAEVIGVASLISGGKKIAENILWCLTDGVTADEWARLDRLWTILPAAAKPDGVRVVWNDAASDRELDAYCKGRHPSSFRLLELLLHGGASITASIRSEDALKDETVPLLVLNPAHYDRPVLEALRKRSAPVIEFGLGARGWTPGQAIDADEPKTWLEPLPSRGVPQDALAACVGSVNGVAAVRPDRKGMEDLRLMSYRSADGSRTVIALNDRSTYLNARILVKGEVAAVEAVTESPSLPVDIRKLPEGDTRLTAKIPPAGVIVLRVDGL